MRKLMTATAALCACAVTVSAGAAWADADVQPAGSVPIPDGPAQTWRTDSRKPGSSNTSAS
ncbi:D-alanyl-D-alanine carboxypeptidase [Mycobacterium tuberculosis]|nr:D-alanyl-D-alanine carboxypeptidase [Mycobacterium tuberculosis]